MWRRTHLEAYSQYPFLLHNDTPKKIVTRTYLTTEIAGSAPLDLTQPLVIYSRKELNGMLLDRAAEAGAEIEKTRILELERKSTGWGLTTRKGCIDADYCIVATGARNSLRGVGTQWAPGDTMMALGYYIPSTQDHVDIQFFPGFEGYIWIFPRDGHLSVGIGGKGESSRAMRSRLERYLDEKGICYRNAEFYGHVLPSLGRPSWRNNRVAGQDWMAVGDAGGLVDPVTGEGLYYALRSADLASDALLSKGREAAAQYRSAIGSEFTEDLEVGSRLAKRLFLGNFFYADVPSRMIQFMRRSPTFCNILQDLFAGTQSYLDLKPRLKSSLKGTLCELLMNAYFRRLVPSP
ncbi:MAG: NAD(P)/FAD-dependent oxidoreductase [Bryobacteraceae bacterium]